MAMTVNIDKAQGLITTRGSGEIGDADFAEMEQLFETDSDFSRKFARICDLTEATDVNVSEALMKKWAEDPIMDRGARHAIVCKDPVVMSRVLEYIKQSRVHLRDASVFPTFDQAENWIRETSQP